MLKMLQTPTNWLLIRGFLFTLFRLDSPSMAILHQPLMSSLGILPNAIPINFSESQYYAILIKPQFRPQDGQN
jgi:hypothetical protein